MNSLDATYPYRSYKNVDPFEVNDSDHVIRIDGDIKAQICTGTELLAIENEDNTVTIHTKLVYTGAPHEWPVETKVSLCYYNAKIEANPINKEDDKLEKVDDIGGITIFEPNYDKKQKGYSKGIELSTDDGLWDVYYDTAEVKVELPN